MEEDRPLISSGLLMTPGEVSTRTFTTARRGYHPDEVRQFLTRVADELAGAAARETELRRALQEALERAAHPELDEGALTAGLGEHAARLIASARKAAAAIVADAETRAAALVHDAEARARQLREDSEGLMARRVAEAEAAGASVRAAAEAEGRATHDRARAEAEAAVAAAQAQGREMVSEARAVRERMLGDLSRRRRAAQVQIDQLMAGRQRLLEAYGVVRRTLEEATHELDAAEAEARVAAEEAARRTTESEIFLRPERVPPAGPSAVPAVDGGATGPASPAEGEALAAPASPPLAPASPPPAPVAAPATATVFSIARSSSARRGALARGRGVATLDPPRAPALRPQSVADAAPVRSGPVAATAEPEPASDPLPVAEPAADGPDPNAASASPSVDDLFARLRREVPTPAPEPGAAAPDEDASGADELPGAVSDENALAGRDAALDPVESHLTRGLKRVLQDDQNEVLDRLRRTRSTSAATVLPDATAQIDRYREAASPWLEQAAVAGAQTAGGGEDAHAGVIAERLARELVEPLRGRLEEALAQGGGDEGAVFDSISSIYRQWKVQQVERLARHGACAAFSAGAFAATPHGTMLRWLVDDEGGRCPDCDDNALAGPVARGEPFPTGQLHPPAHPGCRCLLVTALP